MLQRYVALLPQALHNFSSKLHDLRISGKLSKKHSLLFLIWICFLFLFKRYVWIAPALVKTRKAETAG